MNEIYLTNFIDIKNKDQFDDYARLIFANQKDVINISNTAHNTYAYKLNDNYVCNDMTNNINAYNAFCASYEDLDFKHYNYTFITAILYFNLMFEDVLFTNLLKIKSFKNTNNTTFIELEKTLSVDEEQRLISAIYGNDQTKFDAMLNQNTSEIKDVMTYKDMLSNYQIKMKFLKYIMKVDFRHHDIINAAHTNNSNDITIYKILKIKK